MEILLTNLTPHTEALVSDIYLTLHRPVEYFPIELRPGGGDKSFGSTDTFPADGIYKVWLRTDLPQDAFESNLLHELHHIVQTETGYPSVYNKGTSEFHSYDKPFIQNVGGHLASVILDQDLNQWLFLNGYSHDYFDSLNLAGALQSKDYPYTGLSDPLNFANLTLAILHLALSLDDASVQSLYSAYSKYPRVIATATKLCAQIKSIGVNNPTTAAVCQALLIDTFGLWKYYCVLSPSIKIKTHGDFLKFSAEHSFDISVNI